MKNKKLIFFITIILSFAFVTAVSAQGEGLTIDLSRDFGYGGFNGDIQGTFSIIAKGPANLARVQFFIDATLIGEVTGAPFRLQFLTDDYPTGTHSISAVGYTTDGKILNSQIIGAVFVSKSEGATSAMKMIVPILVVVFGALALSAIVPMITGRRARKIPAGEPRSYTFGGGICPKCHRPFGFSLISMNMIAGKLTPCPHCGRWSLVRRASLSELQAAEQAEIFNEQPQVTEVSEEEKMRKELDDSKYQTM